MPISIAPGTVEPQLSRPQLSGLLVPFFHEYSCHLENSKLQITTIKLILFKRLLKQYILVWKSDKSVFEAKKKTHAHLSKK